MQDKEPHKFNQSCWVVFTICEAKNFWTNSKEAN